MKEKIKETLKTIDNYMSRKDWKELKAFEEDAHLLQFVLGIQSDNLTKGDVVEHFKDIQYHTIEDFKESLKEKIEEFEKEMKYAHYLIVSLKSWNKFKKQLLGDE